LALLVVLPVYAGFGDINITSFSGDCDSVTVTWKSGLGFTRITIINETTGDTIVNGEEDDASGSYTEEFSPPLADGTVLSVTVNPEPMPGDPRATLVVSCDGSTDERYTEMCDDGRSNTNLCEPIAIYPIETGDGIGIDIWDTRRTGSRGQLLYVAAEELDTLPETNCELGQSADGFVSMISLGGHIVVIAGPDDENKTFIFFFEEFPGLPVTDTMFGQLIFDLPACFE
jgi:hypothetical protein